MRTSAWFHKSLLVVAAVVLAALIVVAAWSLGAGRPPDNAAAQGGGVESADEPAVEPQFQEAAEAAVISGTWVMVDYQGSSPASDILYRVNSTAQAHGVPDTNGNPDDVINDFIKVYYIYWDGTCVPLGDECWELHAGPNVIPTGARGLLVDIKAITLKSTDNGLGTARARYRPDGGLLPLAVNEYWRGSQGMCPYDNCGEPYSFARDPAQLPPFNLVSPSPEEWQRNLCPDPYNNDVCQGPYGGAGENYGQALALMGGDAKPNYGSQQPRGGVVLDSRYDALADGGSWWYLVDNDLWDGPNTAAPVPDGMGADSMADVLYAGGFAKSPLPGSVYEPPISYIDQWAYCWAMPHDENNCFNWPETARLQPYDGLQFLSGAKSVFLATVMYDNGAYVDGRYAPGEPVIVSFYNGVAAYQWGAGGNKADTAVLVGYAGVTIVGYGNNFAYPCLGTPGDWQSYASCISGNANTVYGLVERPLVLDPSGMIEEWLPKRVELIP